MQGDLQIHLQFQLAESVLSKFSFFHRLMRFSSDLALSTRVN